MNSSNALVVERSTAARIFAVALLALGLGGGVHTLVTGAQTRTVAVEGVSRVTSYWSFSTVREIALCLFVAYAGYQLLRGRARGKYAAMAAMAIQIVQLRLGQFEFDFMFPVSVFLGMCKEAGSEWAPQAGVSLGLRAALGMVSEVQPSVVTINLAPATALACLVSLGLRDPSKPEPEPRPNDGESPS